jgi:4-amino-4-deoxy-L-arabinose transferase-like glycosyltransferase
MLTTATAILLLVVIFAMFLLFARRIFRLALKLALVGAVIFALLVGGLFGWWRGWFSSSSRVNPPAQTNQRPNSNRHPR